MKIVINRSYGIFGLSNKACERLGITQRDYIKDRTNPELVKVVEELGEEANGMFSKLKVVEIPDDVEWRIAEYDGLEIIEEKARVWY